MVGFCYQPGQKPPLGLPGQAFHFDQARVLRLPLLGWHVWWRGVSWLALVVASHAELTWRAGEGGGLILPALAKSAPTLPSPPRHPGTARCAACGCADEECGVSFSPFWCGHAVTRRWKRVAGRQLLLAVGGAQLTPCSGAERGRVTPARQTTNPRSCQKHGSHRGHYENCCYLATA